jgi:sensor domain CHASE-containing protein
MKKIFKSSTLLIIIFMMMLALMVVLIMRLQIRENTSEKLNEQSDQFFKLQKR